MSTPSVQPARIIDDLAEIARTLGHGHRLALLDRIGDGERSVESLAEGCGLSVANASQHLQQLRRAGLVQARRDGKRVLYRLGTGPVAALLAALRAYAAHRHEEIRAFVTDGLARPERLEAVSVDELLGRMQDDGVVLLDVRPPDEFAQGHLPGAVNIPLDELQRRLGELPRDRDVVAYCRGGYCMLSARAVEVLRAGGFPARRLEAGLPEWQAAGLQVETA
jgi:rhodanese-related sulfurtransferase/DNA-binding transcriptional ArsR family regulator